MSQNIGTEQNIKSYTTDGFTIYQGRNAEGNDHLTLELSSDDDIWLHAKGVPGSHVLIKVYDNLPSKNVIEFAAKVAAKNSKSNLNKVEVIYCKKKFVTKVPGSKPGQVKVDYINSNILFVEK